MRTTRARLVAVVLAVVVSPVVGAAPVGAERGQVSRDRWDETFDVPDFCGSLAVTIHDVGHETVQARTTDAGFPLFSGARTGTFTATDGDGDSITVRHSGHFRDLSVTDNGDGTITVLSEFAGKPEDVVGDDGTKLIKDVGRIVFADTLDDNGTPSNPDDDIFLSSEIVDVAGPHPDAESDFGAFCDAVLDYFAS